MSWVPWLHTRTVGKRFNDLTHVGERWWAVATTGVVWSWCDGGEAPKRCAVMEGHLRAIAMAPGGRVGWIGRMKEPAFGILAKTEDGGSTWEDVTELPDGAPDAICGLEVLSERNAWAVGAFFGGGSASLWHFDGERWRAVELVPAPSALTDVWFFEPRDGAARRGVVAGGVGSKDDLSPAIFFTADGGASWHPATLPGGVPLGRYCWKLHFVDENVGFASLEARSNNGDAALLKTLNGGRDWELIPIVEPTMIAGTVSNLQGVAFAPWDSTLGWVGPRTKGLLTTRNGGANWNEAIEPREVNRILVEGDTVIAAGDALYRYEKGP